MVAPPFSADVYFQGTGGNTGPLTQMPWPNTLCIMEQEFNHTVLTMNFWGGDAQQQTLMSGAPVQVNFGRPPVMRIFYGYVNHVSRTNNQLTQSREGRNSIAITCIGASWPLKQSASNVYQNMTNTQIVAQIAAQFNLGTYIVDYPLITSPTKQQGNLSYWQFCVQLMQEIGYTFYCDGVQLVAKPRQTDPSLLNTYVVVYDYAKNPSSLPVFSPTLGSNSPGGGMLRNRVLGGIDATTLQPYVLNVSGSNTPRLLGTTQDTPPFTEIQQFTSQNINEANVKLQGVAQANQMYLNASATGPGDSMMGPGQLAFVQNANGSWNGLWWACAVKHDFSQTTYSMEMQLGRDSYGQTASMTITPQTSLPEEAAILLNSSWRAAA